MGFRKIEKGYGGKGGILRGVSVRRTQQGGQTAIVFGTEPLEALGIAAGDKVDVSVGDGSNLGEVMFTKGTTYKLFLGPGRENKSPNISLGFARLGFDPSTKRFHPPYRIEGKMLVIDLRSLLPAKQRAA